MTDRFREDGLQAIAWAQEAAQRLGRDTVGPIDLAFGIADETLVAGGVIDRSGAMLGSMTRMVATISASVRVAPYRRALPFDRDADRVLTFAGEEAEALGDEAIGSEHILLALLRIPDTPKILSLFDISYDTASEAVIRFREDPAG